jgi:malonyl-CoA decarboxylase
VTLSPLPGFAAWLAQAPATARRSALLEQLGRPDWTGDMAAKEAVEAPLLSEAAYYLAEAKGPAGLPLDPVARFHLGNGAQLERIDFLADTSPKAMRESHGLMVNYLYRPSDIEKNHELYTGKGAVVAARAVRKLISERKLESAPPAPRLSSNPALESKR